MQEGYLDSQRNLSFFAEEDSAILVIGFYRAMLRFERSKAVGVEVCLKLFYQALFAQLFLVVDEKLTCKLCQEFIQFFFQMKRQLLDKDLIRQLTFK